MWNLYHNLFNNLPLTNNSAECFNSHYNAAQVGKPNIYKCIVGIGREFDIASIRLTQLQNDNFIEKQKTRKEKLHKKYSEIKEIINAIDYNNLDDYFTKMTPYVEMKRG